MKRYPFTSEQRLKREKEFAIIFKKGKLLESDAFKVYYKENGLRFSRLGISISRRVGNSVFRNKIKRIVREWFRCNCLKFLKPVDIVLIFKKEIPDYSHKSLRKKLEEIAAF